MWAYACRARVVGIGCAMLLRMCDMRAAWARVEGAMLQGFSRSLSLSLSRSLSLSLARSLARSLSLSLSQECQEWCASQTFLTGQSLQGQPPLECSVCSHELPMCVRGHMRMGMCVRARVRRKIFFNKPWEPVQRINLVYAWNSSPNCGWPIHHMCCDPFLVMVLNTT